MTADAAQRDDEALAHPEAPVLPVGFVVGGKYEIKRVLGAGGNGAVYEGEHEAVGHRVAIKVVHPTLMGREDVMARFRREARVCGSLRHANIGQVYDIGELEDGSPYMVMQLQDGRSLADVIDETKLPIPAIVNLAQQLLSALGAAHHAGIIHRDVKPDNVMIVRNDGGDAIVKLVDFGISQAIDPKSDIGGDAEDGTIIGSPDYMSPEQLRGEPLDIRTDIYSTGVLCYELITRRMPFEGKRIEDLMVSVLRDPITPIRDLRRDCPVELERVVLKAMSRAADDRYASSADMSRDLATARQHVRAGSSSLARLSDPPPPPGGPGSVTVRRRRTVDSRTLEGLRVQTMRLLPAKPGSRSGTALWGPVVLALGALALALVWMTTDGSVDSVDSADTSATALPLQDPPVQAGRAALAPESPAQPASPQQALAPPPAPSTPDRADVESGGPAAAAVATDDSASTTAVEPAAPAAAAVRTVSTSARPVRKRDERPVAIVTPVHVEPGAAPADATTVQELSRQAATAVIQGKTAWARSLYRMIVRRSPRTANAWRGLAITSNRLGDRAEAARAFDRYLALRPDARDAERIRTQLGKTR